MGYLKYNENTLPMEFWLPFRRTATPDIKAVGTLIIVASICRRRYFEMV